jgi:RHS repeat-associated protein
MFWGSQGGARAEWRRTIRGLCGDAKGRLAEKDDGTNVEAYGYDFRNLMTDYDGPGSSNDATYKYAASGLRVQKTVGGSTTTKYYLDGLNVVAEYNGSDQLLRTYVTPGLDQNLSLTASESTYYYLTDALSSIRQLLDADQSTQNCYDYEAFGKVYGTPTENLAQPFRFTGREWDGETGAYYYRSRRYEAQTGRFIQRDQFLSFLLASRAFRVRQSSLHRLLPLSRYVGNRPVLWSDALGLYEKPVHLWYTYEWAKAVLGPGEDAIQIAFGDEWFDENPKTGPHGIGMPGHFLSCYDAICRLCCAYEKGARGKEFGAALHRVQDCFSHYSKDLDPAGHGITSLATDPEYQVFRKTQRAADPETYDSYMNGANRGSSVERGLDRPDDFTPDIDPLDQEMEDVTKQLLEGYRDPAKMAEVCKRLKQRYKDR